MTSTAQHRRDAYDFVVDQKEAWASLSTALLSSDCREVEAASALLGRLARIDSAASECLEFQLYRALEWLQPEACPHFRAACLVVAELAENAPTLTYLHMRQVGV